MTGMGRIGGEGTGAATTYVHLEGVRKEALETGRNRLIVAGALLVMAFVAISVRLVDLMALDGAVEPRVATVPASATAPAGRADIVDRNGVVVATSLPTASLYADPANVLDAREAADELMTVLPGLDRAGLVARLSTDRRFVWIRRNLTPEEQYAVNRLGIPGLAFQREDRRIYPQGPLLAHVLGYTDTDGRGIAGVERHFDARLADAADPLRLSVDVRVQSLVRQELLAAMETFQAVGAAGLVMDVNTGELLALVSLPDFDPNGSIAADSPAVFNRATKGVYEMGSTFKLFTAAMALDSGTIGLQDGYDASEPIRVARFTISDFHGEDRWLSVPEILVYSSNIGAAKMALDVGTDQQKAYLAKLGLLSSPAVELPEVGAPLTPGRWREINTMTISFGHGIAVSPLQLAGGVAWLVNGGIRYPVTLQAVDDDAPPAGRRVVSSETSRQVRGLMRLVVSRGTGKKAAAQGYLVGGKTGTADKEVGGRYRRDRRIASFVGAFPIEKPRYVVFAMLDEPKGNESTFNYATGGWVAAPSVGRIIERMGPLLGVPVDDNAEPATDDGEPIELALERTLASY